MVKILVQLLTRLAKIIDLKSWVGQLSITRMLMTQSTTDVAPTLSIADPILMGEGSDVNDPHERAHTKANVQINIQRQAHSTAPAQIWYNPESETWCSNYQIITSFW